MDNGVKRHGAEHSNRNSGLHTLEVESALVEHPAVEEAVVVSTSSEPGHLLPVAFITVREGYQPSADLARELTSWIAGRRIAAFPEVEIMFSNGLPKSRSGKLMRHLLNTPDRMTGRQA